MSKDSDLIIAIKNGNLQKIEDLLALGTNPDDAEHYEGEAGPLETAIFCGHLDIAKKVLEKMNIQNELFTYAEDNNLIILKFLLENGADPNKCNPNYNNYTALELATKNGHEDVVKFLLENGAKSTLDLFYFPAEIGHLNIAQLLIKHRANLLGHYKKPDSALPFEIAIKNGHKEVAKELLGLDDCKGNIFNAITHNNVEAIKFIIDLGINLNQCIFSGGYTPFLTAIEGQHNEIVELLWSAADLNQVHKKSGNTALHCAVRGKNNEMVKRLLDAGINLSHRNKKGETALDLADKAGNTEATGIICNSIFAANLSRDSVLKAVKIKQNQEAETTSQNLSAPFLEEKISQANVNQQAPESPKKESKTNSLNF